MITDSRTLILVADGRRARVFEEARRGGPLSEHPDWLAGVMPPHVTQPGPRGGSHSSVGHATHSTAREGGRDKAETGFLAEVLRRVEGVFIDHAFDELVLIAAPRALGVLRRHLSPNLKAKLVLSEPHDRLAADLREIEQAVRSLRRVNA